MRKIIALFASAIMAATASLASVPETTIGGKAPEFSLTDLNGTTHSLSQYLGKVVVLEWTNPDCPFVKRHYKAETMKKLAANYKDKGVVWLTINSTHFVDSEKLKAWATKEGITYPVLNDQSGVVGKMYNAKTTPHMFVVDKEGKLAYDGAIDAAPHGDEPDSKNFVAQAIEDLIAGVAVKIATTTPYGCSVKYKS